MYTTSPGFGPYLPKHLLAPTQQEQLNAEVEFSPTPLQIQLLTTMRERRDDFSAAAAAAGLIDHPPEAQTEFEKAVDRANLLGIPDIFVQDWDSDAAAELARRLQDLHGTAVRGPSRLQ